MDATNTIIIGLLGMLAIFSLVIGLDKMIKIVVGNYLLSMFMLALGSSIDIFVNFIHQSQGDQNVFLKSYVLPRLENGKSTFLLIVFFLLLLLIFKRSSFTIFLPDGGIVKGIMTALFIPLTVFSFLLNVIVTILGSGIFSNEALNGFALQITNYQPLIIFIQLTPIRFLLYGVITLYMIHDIRQGSEKIL